jgi:hypothetical protein
MSMASLFILPLTVLVFIQTQNFLSGKTTQERIKANQVRGIPIQEMTGRDLADQMVLNNQDKLFRASK